MFVPVCLFKAADYYFGKNGMVLEYWKAEAADSGSAQHIVLYTSIDPQSGSASEFYYYDDKTGELSHQ